MSNISSSPDAANQPSTVTQVLLDAGEAANRGDFQSAYLLGQKAAQLDPESLQAWLLCAETAPSIGQAVACLNKANALQPTHPDAKQKTYQLVQKLLKQDAFLLYLDETDALYHIRSGEKISLSVPKDRSLPEAYPARRPALLQSAYRWLWLAFLGLPLAGIGALVFTPLAAAAGAGLYLKTSSRTNRIYSLVVILLSGGLWIVGLLLAVIFLVHLI